MTRSTCTISANVAKMCLHHRAIYFAPYVAASSDSDTTTTIYIYEYMVTLRCGVFVQLGGGGEISAGRELCILLPLAI